MKPKEKIKRLNQIADEFSERLKACDICPRNCRINRLKGETGYCAAGKTAAVYTAFLHQGEEPVISAEQGSGTIFFSGCNLKCIYCQNYKFSHYLKGNLFNQKALSKLMLNLQNKGADNINFVTPSHFLPQIIKALILAFEADLKLPLVYNSSGYEKKEIIKKLSGIVDIYLPDFKYLTPETAAKYSQAEDYPDFAKVALKEMSQQPDSLMIIRHLVLPGHIEESKKIISWIKKNTPNARLSLMSQYQPYFRANQFEEINRRVTAEGYKEVKDFLADLNIDGWQQELESKEDLAGVYFSPLED